MDDLDQKVKEYLIAHIGDVDDDVLLEELRYGYEDVFTAKVGSHRWYDDELTVVKIGEKFVGFLGYYMTGDACASDMGLEFDWSSVAFYEPYEVTTTKYKRILEN